MKNKKDLSVLTKLLGPYVKQNKKGISLAVVLIFIANLTALSIPLYTAAAIDHIGLTAVNFDGLYKSLLTAFTLAILTYALEFSRGFVMIRVSQKMVLSLREDVFSHLLKLKLSFVEDSSRGDIINRVSIDIETISTLISTEAITLLTGVVTIFGALCMMLYMSPIMALVYVVLTPLLFLFAKYIKKRTKQNYAISKAKMGIMSGHTEEMFGADKTIKMFALEQKTYNDFEDLSKDFQKYSTKSEQFAGFMMPTASGINNIGFIFLALLGSFLVSLSKITIGEVSGFIIYSKKFTGPIVEVANIFNNFQSALTSCERILEIFESDKEPTAEFAPVEVSGDIKFENVSFSYDGKTDILKNINFEVKKGEKIAIVGHTGCGKTTLISLLMRFYDVTEGRILIDGKDIKSYHLDNYRKNFGLVLQENFLFDMSILDNVDYGFESGDAEQIKAAIKEVSMDKFIETMPSKYETMLSYENTAISQGQIQLLVIARAMLLNPSVYIFDEATSNVDLITEEQIKKVTNKVMDNKTAFIIAHRLSTISHADKIIVMSDGVILEMGSHHELLEKKGAYYKLVNA